MTAGRRSLIATGIIPFALTLFLSCAEEPTAPEHEPPTPPTEQLPELSLVGGAQDLWPFDFGFDATMAVVAAEFGEPSEKNAAPVGANGDGESGSTAVVEVWQYQGVRFDFFVDTAQDLEFLLSVEVSDAAITLGSGVSLGMSVDDLLGIMGEPAVNGQSNLVYFYLTNTIEYQVGGGQVTAVTLSRAMP